MLRNLLVIVAALALAGCQESKTKVLLGGTLIASPGAAPIEDSIVVVTSGTIRAAGTRKDVPVPQDSDRIDMTGKWLVPAGAEPIAAGKPADLNVLEHAPRSTADAPVRKMTGGNWAN